jgi:hypothetical protein
VAHYDCSDEFSNSCLVEILLLMSDILSECLEKFAILCLCMFVIFVIIIVVRHRFDPLLYSALYNELFYMFFFIIICRLKTVFITIYMCINVNVAGKQSCGEILRGIIKGI